MPSVPQTSIHRTQKESPYTHKSQPTVPRTCPHTCTARTCNSRVTGTRPRPMHENTARAKTPHAHKSSMAGPGTHTRSHIAHVKLSSDCTTNAQKTHSTSQNLKKDKDLEHKRAQLPADGTANTNATTPHPRKSQQTTHKTHAQLVVELVTGRLDFDSLHQHPRDGCRRRDGLSRHRFLTSRMTS